MILLILILLITITIIIMHLTIPTWSAKKSDCVTGSKFCHEGYLTIHQGNVSLTNENATGECMERLRGQAVTDLDTSHRVSGSTRGSGS